MKPQDETIARLLAGDLNEAERQALAEWLADDPSTLKELGGHALVEGMLGVALEDELTAGRHRRKIMEALRQADQDDFVAGVQTRIRRRSWHYRIAAIAALLIFGIGLWAIIRPVEVATISRLETVSWGDGSSFAEGGVLKSGARLRLDRGLVELNLGGRGRMILEGPADIEFVTAMESKLRRGRVLMRVNEAGHGYRVETPKGSVIDLGTEFGVSVGDDAEVETHVLSGEVEAFPNGSIKVLLKKGEALRFSGGDDNRFTTDGGSFYTELPPPQRGSPKSVHWPMEADSGGLDRAVVSGFWPGSHDMVLEAMDEGKVPARVAGLFGSALAFDGKGGFAESAFRGIGGQKPRTVSFWVKVPQDFSVREGFGIVSWGSIEPDGFGQAWQISINPLPKDGPIGCLRVGAHGGQIVGKTDLRDGRWHHVAAVLYQASRPDIGKHVLIYLDGQLEPISRRALRELNTRVDDAAHGVWLGRNISYKSSWPDHQHGGFFRGEVDEVFIFAGALGQAEIRHLMKTNELPK
jgi:hypothetical protein